jgi:glycerol-3-phosphate dehydrogenase (NAD(P)+)
MFLMMYLIRRGFTGVAKKEAQNTPGFGTFMKMADMAFIDRHHTGKAIDALQPAVDRLKQGLCVAIAPEGTRSWSPEVGPFKKGAFHMARQAGVPVVPVVIRNAGEVMGATTRPCAQARCGWRCCRRCMSRTGRSKTWRQRLPACGSNSSTRSRTGPRPGHEERAMSRPIRVAVLGAGSWGTTVGSLAARNAETIVWARRAETAAQISGEHRNDAYLKGLACIRTCVRPRRSRKRCATATLVVGVPSHSFRETLKATAPLLRPWVPVLSPPGLEQGTQQRMTQIIHEELPVIPQGCSPGQHRPRVAGPGRRRGAAMPDAQVAHSLQPLFASPVFRVYTNTDVIGCELGGPLKNVIAISAGMAEGLGVGENTRAMVITRGLAEITRLGVALGGRAETFSGLTGLGDLLTTCMSPLSRNRQVGEQFAKGKTTAEIVASMNMVAEGIKTSSVVMELAAKHGIEMPIAAEVAAVVKGERGAVEAFRGLRRLAPGAERGVA